MDTNVTYCQLCSKPLAGRSDKKYCSDQCRAQLNNKKKKMDIGELIIQDINRILRKNRSILKSFSPLGKIRTHRRNLLLHGFDFDYFTHQFSLDGDHTYTFCYEYGYMLLPEAEILIVNASHVRQDPFAGYGQDKPN